MLPGERGSDEADHHGAAGKIRVDGAELEAWDGTAGAGPSIAGGRTESAERARRRGDMDIAIVVVMRDAMLRRSEAAALTWADLELQPDGTGRLTVRRSKGDQVGAGAQLFIGREAMAALERIRPESPAPHDPVFGGLSGRAISDRIRRAARAAGLEADSELSEPSIGRGSGPRIALLRKGFLWVSSPAVGVRRAEIIGVVAAVVEHEAEPGGRPCCGAGRPRRR